MRRLILLAALTLTPALQAAPPQPVVELRVRSVNDLLAKAEYLGEIVNQAEPAKQMAGFVKAMTDEKKGIEGIDPAKPIGLYAGLNPDVVSSPVVLLVPVADEKAVVGLLSGRLNLEPKKGDDGIYSLDIPAVPLPLFFRIADGYAHVTVGSKENVLPANALKPAAFFGAADAADVGLRVHIARIPADVRKSAFAQAELKAADAKAADQPGETPAQKKLRGWGSDQVLAIANAIFTDGKEFRLSFTIDPKAGALTTQAELTATEGSPLAGELKRMGEQTGVSGSLPANGAALAGGVRLTLPAAAKESLAPLVDALIKEHLAGVKEGERQGAKLVLEALAPTLKSGDYELGGALADRGGKADLVLAAKVAEGKKIETTLKQFAPFAPEEKAKFAFDQKTVNGLTLHTVTVGDKELDKVFGTRTVWLGTGETRLVAGLGGDGKLAAKAAEASASGVPILSVRAAVPKLVGLFETQVPKDRVKELVKEAGADGDEAGMASLTLTGGDSLKLTMRVSGTAVKLGVLLDQERKK
ncbi:MAG: hypothetical protein U0871_11305 [Gemmataceae bacterium]